MTNLPAVPGDSSDPAQVALLRDLNTNLWASIKSTVDTDKVTTSALYLSNLGGMVLTIIASDHTLPLVATVGSLGVINLFLYRIFKNSQMELRRVISLLTDVYTDHGLGAYFDQMREEYFVERYKLRLQLCPVLFGIAVVLGMAFGFAG
jgi:hypothetical protein